LRKGDPIAIAKDNGVVEMMPRGNDACEIAASSIFLRRVGIFLPGAATIVSGAHRGACGVKHEPGEHAMWDTYTILVKVIGRRALAEALGSPEQLLEAFYKLE
jgi:hypothetical protein